MKDGVFAGVPRSLKRLLSLSNAADGGIALAAATSLALWVIGVVLCSLYSPWPAVCGIVLIALGVYISGRIEREIEINRREIRASRGVGLPEDDEHA